MLARLRVKAQKCNLSIYCALGNAQILITRYSRYFLSFISPPKNKTETSFLPLHELSNRIEFQLRLHLIKMGDSATMDICSSGGNKVTGLFVRFGARSPSHQPRMIKKLHIP